MSIINTSTGGTLTIRKVEVKPNQGALIWVYYYDEIQSLSKYRLEMSGQDYADWGNSDQYLIDWVIKNVASEGVKAVVPPAPNFKEDEPIVKKIYTGEQQPEQQQQTANISSAQSVHNDNDVAKINDLETQLATLQTKMASMLQIMISKGLV